MNRFALASGLVSVCLASCAAPLQISSRRAFLLCLLLASSTAAFAVTPAPLTFDENGRTFPKVSGPDVVFCGGFAIENATVTLSGSVTAQAVVRGGRWETGRIPLESIAKSSGEITATARAVNGTVAGATTLRYNIVNLLQEGAKGDGQTDDTAAIKAAIKKARTLENGIVYAPSGHVYAHADIIDLDGGELLGGGEQTVFRATNVMKSPVQLKGDGARLRNLTLETPLGDTKRQTTPQTTAIWINRAANFWIDRVTVKGAASAGIINIGGYGTKEFPARITNCHVSGTLADGIHNTGGAHDLRVEGNTCRATGDDLIAVVTYGGKMGTPAINPETICRDIAIVRNNVAENKWARGISVVGGVRVLIEDNDIASTKAAGIYLGSEGSYMTQAVADITVRNNRLTKCSYELPAHSTIFLNGRTGFPVMDIKLEGNVITNAPTAAIRLQNSVQNVTITGNQVKGARGGIQVKSATNVTFSGNQLEQIAGSAVLVEKEAGGFCKIIGNNLTATNTSGQGRLIPIIVENAPALTEVEVSGNKHRPAGARVEKVVDCAFPKAVVRNNN